MIRVIEHWVEDKRTEHEQWIAKLEAEYAALQRRNKVRAQAAIKALGEKWVLHPNYKGSMK